jgi:EmrB/QacA subfamily drug resistance transporter
MTKQQKSVLLISVLASFVGVMDGFIVNVALPAISKDLGGGLLTQQWVVDAYLITLGSLMLVAGSLSDLFGRRKVLLAGLWIFLATSLLCAVAWNSTALIASRALQGIGGAVIVPSSLAMIISTFSGEAQGKAIGRWTAWTGISALIAPLIGGVILDTTSWQVIFLANILPIGVTLWLLHRLDLGEKRDPTTRLDVRGSVVGALGLGSVVYALIEQGHYGWQNPVVWGTLVFGISALVYFIWYEGRIKQPMLPLGLFRARNFSVGNAATITIYAGLATSSFLVTIFVQQFGGYSAIEAGLIGVPITMIMFFLAPRFGALAGKFGPRFFMAAGPIFAALGFLLLLRVDERVDYLTQILPGYIIFGLGLSMTVAPLTSAVLSCIHPKQAGIGSAINNAISRIAGLLAVASIGIIVGTGNIDVTDLHNGLIFVAVLMILGGITSAIGIQNNARRLGTVDNAPTKP